MVALGGQGGVVNMLRAVEFARRLGTGGYCPDILEDVKSVAQNMERVFAQEAWRRWTLGSFKRSEHQQAGDLLAVWQIMMEVECRGTCDASRWFDMKWRRDSRPNIIDRIAEQAAIRIRGCRPEDTVLTLHNITWSMPTTLQGMKEWTCTMSEGMFEQGSLLERFTYVYGLYMAAGWADGTETSEWCKNAVEETAEWMCKLSTHREPDLLLNRRWVLSATRVALLRQNDLTLKRMKCSPVHLEKAGGPFGHQILTPENIEGILSMSRIVPKKADCLNDEEQKDEEFSKPIATQYRKNPAEFNKALVLKIGTISCDHADKEKLGMTDLPVKHSDVISRKRPAETGSRLESSLPLLKRIRDDDNDSIIEGQGKSWQNGVRAHIIPQVQPPSGAMDQDGEHGVTLTTGPVRRILSLSVLGLGDIGRDGKPVMSLGGPNEKLVAAMGPQAKALHRHLHAVGTLHTENENLCEPIIAVFTQTIWVPTLKVFTKDYMGAYTEVILKIPRGQSLRVNIQIPEDDLHTYLEIFKQIHRVKPLWELGGLGIRGLGIGGMGEMGGIREIGRIGESWGIIQLNPKPNPSVQLLDIFSSISLPILPSQSLQMPQYLFQCLPSLSPYTPNSPANTSNVSPNTPNLSLNTPYLFSLRFIESFK
ncbi:hypothetical protein BU17DRAFT_69217 [Hysterangium stoloniferum]|nr:hypothetical protein BU17DRAFT_69217 [Hysterangium stoloniferum]